MNTTNTIAHSHVIRIKKVSDHFKSDSAKEIVNQFFTEFSLNEGIIKYCFNNNLPTKTTKFYHEFSMVVKEQEKFVEKDFIFFIPEPNDRIIIDEIKLTAEFIMRQPHAGSATCNPLLEVIFDNIGVFNYHLDSDYLLPMFGFYDGNSQQFSNRIKQHDVFGYFYRCNKKQFDDFSKYVSRDRTKKHEFDLIDDPKVSGTGGYWYHDSILAYFDDKFNKLNEWK
ncbi:MAG: hypothetical protein KA270_04865 [Saprospiraceae bacterium]|jgi:hypothetical protein|nr:hypothetical protein [Saprospiraceae bacterium]MBP6566476.1 hypothetical protein [Saprospiraceae bacterium]